MFKGNKVYKNSLQLHVGAYKSVMNMVLMLLRHSKCRYLCCKRKYRLNVNTFRAKYPPDELATRTECLKYCEIVFAPVVMFCHLITIQCELLACEPQSSEPILFEIIQRCNVYCQCRIVLFDEFIQANIGFFTLKTPGHRQFKFSLCIRVLKLHRILSKAQFTLEKNRASCLTLRAPKAKELLLVNRTPQCKATCTSKLSLKLGYSRSQGCNTNFKNLVIIHLSCELAMKNKYVMISSSSMTIEYIYIVYISILYNLKIIILTVHRRAT